MRTPPVRLAAASESAEEHAEGGLGRFFLFFAARGVRTGGLMVTAAGGFRIAHVGLIGTRNETILIEYQTVMSCVTSGTAISTDVAIILSSKI